MPKMLGDEGTDYDDGTPASESQQAKDVTTFLSWYDLVKSHLSSSHF
jgi:ubiquinol-cytochrome c reductase cytochrome c1 subunit